jgi:uroporphyrinogen-III synthase
MISSALRGVRVLVTRPADPDSDFIRLLEERGAKVTSVPLIAIGPPPDERALQAAVDRASSFAWLVFTSAAGVESFARRRKGALPNSTPRLAAIGVATARALEEALERAPDVVPQQFSGESLADAILEQATMDERVLIFQASDARPTLAARLRGAGRTVETVPAYSTVELQVPDLAERIAQTDVIALASPSAVRSLVRAMGTAHAPAKLRGKLLVCIGPLTLFEARQFGLHVEIVPETTTLPALVDALCTFYSTQPPKR